MVQIRSGTPDRTLPGSRSVAQEDLRATDRTRVPPVRYERMLTNPFVFLRGAAAVMAEDPPASTLVRAIPTYIVILQLYCRPPTDVQ